MSVRIKPRSGKKPIVHQHADAPSVDEPPVPSIPEVMTSEPESIIRLREESPDVSVSERATRTYFYIGCIIVVIVAALSIGLYVSAKVMPKQQVLTPETAPVPSEQPTPTPSPSSIPISFEILNGSGKAGAAKQAAETVKLMGFEVTGIGNTDEREGNMLYLSEAIRSRSSEITAILSKEFKISDPIGTLSTSGATARLILGR